LALFKRKPLEELTPAYRRRIERLEEQGYSRSQARGHATKTEFAVTQTRLAASPDNTQYLLKRVAQLKDPALIRQWNELHKQGELVKKLPKGSAAREEATRKRDAIARDLATKIWNRDGKPELYAVPTWGKGLSAADSDALEEDIDEDEEY
jgi:hypothetical protein